MEEDRKKIIANSFIGEHISGTLDIKLSLEKFSFLEKGIFANEVDGMWNIFTHKENIYLSRRLTEKCIYKINFDKTIQWVSLNKIQVTYDLNNAISSIDDHIKHVKKIFQVYLGIENLHTDDRLNLLLVKIEIEKFDRKNLYKKSITTKSVESTLNSFNHVINFGGVEITGLEELIEAVSQFDKNTELLCLYLTHRNNIMDKASFFFNKDASLLLGKVIINHIL